MDSPFDVLGVNGDADEEEIAAAYRRRVKETHPDQSGSAAEFKRVQEAYVAIEVGKADSTSVPAAADIDTEYVDARPGGPRANGASVGRQEPTRMEYLDYEVLAEHGWDIDDEELFQNAADAGLDPDEYGRLVVRPGETILEAAEQRGFAWPYACRGGACANCAVAVVHGEVTMPRNHVLSEAMFEEGVRLSCISRPTSEELRVVFNVKELPELDELRLPAQQFR